MREHNSALSPNDCFALKVNHALQNIVEYAESLMLKNESPTDNSHLADSLQKLREISHNPSFKNLRKGLRNRISFILRKIKGKKLFPD